VLTIDTPAPERPKRTAAIAGALALTGALAWLAITLGTVAYQARVVAMHNRRLQGMLAAKPLEAQVVAGLEAEGTMPRDIARTADEREALARRATPPRAHVLAPGATVAVTRAFVSGEMLYLVHFDATGTMVGFTLAGG